MFSCFGCYFHQQSVLVVFIFDYFVLIELLYILLSVILNYRHFNSLYFIFVVKKGLDVAYLEFIFVGVLVFLFVACKLC
jgi:hypothetical protein